MLIIGSHVGFTKDKQLLGSLEEALSYNANTFMFYTGAPQNTKRNKIEDGLTLQALNIMKEKNIDYSKVVVHAPYIINLANAANKDFGVSFLRQELSRAKKLGINKVVLHPGSHVGLGIEMGINNIIDCLNEVLTKDTKVIVCLETMAGKGTELGISFEQINQIIDGVKFNDKLGVCLDTCHINDAGYDLNKFDDVLIKFDSVIGLDRLKVLHINDSKNEIGAKKDRHENIGYGTIGFDNLISVIYNPKLKDVPKILETPYVDTELGKLAPYKQEIKMIREKKFNPNLVNDIILDNK